jgi:hypothetical protein
VLLPAARRLCPDKETAQRLSLQTCGDEHSSEAAHFEELGRLLKEVKAFARWGPAHGTRIQRSRPMVRPASPTTVGRTP